MEAVAGLIKFLVLSMVIYPAAISPASGQITTICTTGMISSFTPCLNYVTGSSANGSSPTADCCQSLASLVGNSAGCLCLLLTANVPFRVPINRTLAISLPRACRIPAVPLQCKYTSIALPPAGTIVPAPALPPLPPRPADPPVTATEAGVPASSPPAPSLLIPTTVSPPPPALVTLNPSSAHKIYDGFSTLSIFALVVLGLVI
ncbi:non-specific lipid transfer protein GPI-anchored 16-like [Nymphaea colorata]|nr:non-specific lipid transfer protein GPI-anchored 16-like [Nymphaea colorata]